MGMTGLGARRYEPKRYGNGKGDAAEGKDGYTRGCRIGNEQEEGCQTDSGHGVAEKTENWLAEVGCIADLRRMDGSIESREEACTPG